MAELVDVNAAPQKEASPSIYASPQEESTCKMVDDLLQKAKKARKKWDSTWHNNYEFVFGGRQWEIQRPTWRFAEVHNRTWSSIVTEVGIQTDARPKVEFGAQEPSDLEFTSRLEEVNKANWVKYGWQSVVTDEVQLCKWVHVAHAEVCWNPELQDGIGDIDFKMLDPFYAYWDPVATCIEDAKYFVYAAPVRTAELKAKYPEKKDSIKSDIETFGSKYGDVVHTTTDTWRYGSGSMNPRSYRDWDRYGGEAMTYLIRCWILDETVVEEKDEAKGDYVTKKVYPKGRYIEKACNVVLQDGPNGVRIGDKVVPYEDGMIPVARLVNYSMSGEYAGEHEVTHLKGPQRFINYVRSFIADSMKQAGSPKVVIGAPSGVDPDHITNEPGQKIIVNDAQQLRFEPGQGIPPGMQAILADAEQAFDKVSGIGDVIRGAVDPAVTSGLLFDGYVEAAQVRPRLKNRNLDQFLQRVGQLMLSRYLQFYTAPRVFRITNKQGYPEHVEFFMSTDETGKKVGNFNNLTTGEQVSAEVKGTPDVTVTSGSSLPFAKAQKTQTALNLFGQGAIDREALLETIDFPGKEKIMERMQKAEMEQAAAQGGEGAVQK